MGRPLPAHASIRAAVAPAADIAFALGVSEALLEDARAESAEAFLHVWRPAARGVVLGSACRVAAEVDREACRARDIGIFRRVSGGGTVLVGTETWCYSCVLAKSLDPGGIHATFAWLHEVVSAALAARGVAAVSAPVSDLAVRGADGSLRKLAGHSQKRTRNGVLCEGTLLGDAFPFPLSEVLHHPPREPEYRQGRAHEDFITDLRAAGARHQFADFAADVLAVLGADAGEIPPSIAARAAELARERYLSEEWTGRM